MSVYLPHSEISLFNKADKGEAIKISPEFYAVMITSQKLYTMTNGAWDGTVKPLVDLWGFGTKKEIIDLPSSETIKAHLQNTGFDQIIIGEQNFHTLQKKSAGVTLDLGSIAKGFGVDAVAQLLKSQRYYNFLVEIGGEVFAAGEKTDGKPWMVGISKPDKGANLNQYQPDGDGIYRALPLWDKALATSGDYMNFTTIQGKTYSHIINPVTGYPIDNGVVSASVIADNCTFADGLATALMVMGHERGTNVVNTLKNVDCLIIVRNKEGKLTDYKSNKWPSQ
jgi:thiamine biosynthesis lipoprotein